MLWSKQYYEYDVHRWLREHSVDPWNSSAAASPVRNVPWFHMVASDIISMPDKWEYPWFAAWDLAFHCAPLSLVDVDFAKEQVELLLRTRYMHPNGQIPAYEWNFSDVNPPVTAWAALYVYEREAEIRGEGDRRVPRARVRPAADQLHVVGQPQGPGRPQPVPGRLPRASTTSAIFDRSAPLPGGGTLEQADGTAWMALYCQWMLQIAVELAKHDAAYFDMAIKFVAHFLWISVAMNPPEGDAELWDEEDGFYYDVMRTPDGSRSRSRCARWSDCCRCARRPCSTAIWSSATREVVEVDQRVPRALLATRCPTLAHCGGPERRGEADPGARRRGAAAADPRRDARRERIPRRARDPRGIPAGTSSSPIGSTGAARITTCTTCPPSQTPACSAGTPTGEARCGSR